MDQEISYKVDPSKAFELFEKNKKFYREFQVNELEKVLKENKKITLVYQMGKVGSTSYANSLQKIDGLKVFHVHRLLAKSNEKMIKHYLVKGMLRLAVNEYKWQILSNFIRDICSQIFIISAMRNPVERNMSAYFQNIKLLTGSSNATELVDLFFKSYSHDVPLTWFDEQFKEALGIDIFSYDFNKERGWEYFSQGKYNCLLMTAEADNASKIEGINEFMDLDLESIGKDNVGEKKEYAEIYKLFKKTICFPDVYLDKYFNNKVVEHFYTDKMINSFRAKFL